MSTLVGHLFHNYLIRLVGENAVNVVV